MPCISARQALNSPVPYSPDNDYASPGLRQRGADDEPAAPAINFSTWTVSNSATTKPSVTQGDSSYTGVLRDVDLGFTTVALPHGTTTTYSYADTTTPRWPPVTTASAPAPKELMPELPDWPPILTFFLFAWLGFAWMLAAFLYFSQFPRQLEWLGEAAERVVLFVKGDRGEAMNEVKRGKGRDGYVRVLENTEDDIDEDGNSDAGLLSKAARDATTNQKPQGASTALPSGLGISLSDQRQDDVPLPAPAIRLRKPRSFNDLDTQSRSDDEHQPLNRGEHLLTHLTAPLPSRLTFSPLALSRSTSRTRLAGPTDLENGLHTPGSSSSSSPDERDRHADDGKGGCLSAWLESVNAGIESVAGTMARLAYDHVGGQGAEEGLLLPVRQEEREGQALTLVG